MKNMHLPYIPFCRADESPTSVIQRIATLNGFKSCIHLLVYLRHATGISNLGNFLLANSGIAKVIDYCMAGSATHAVKGFYKPTQPLMKRSNAIIKGIEILYSNLRCSETALCTQCLKEGCEKYPKDIKLFVNCPFHRRTYIFSCPSCGTRLHWKKQLTDNCACGKRLKSPKVSAKLMQLDLHLWSLIEQGDSERLASIQRFLTMLENETHSCEEAVKSARRALAIATSAGDVDMMTKLIHQCLPSSTADEVDVIMILIRKQLSDIHAAQLRDKLTSSMSKPTTSIATITLGIVNLIEYLGITESTWYAAKPPLRIFGGSQRGSKVSLDEAINLKRYLIASFAFKDGGAGIDVNLKQQQLLSIQAVADLTALPVEVISALAVSTNILGYKSQHLKQKANGAELVFTRRTIEIYNRRYVCNHRLPREWNTPSSKIDEALDAFHSKLRGCISIQGTIIMHRKISARLFRFLNNSKRHRRIPEGLELPRLAPKKTAGYLTTAQCGSLLSRPRREITFLIRRGLIPCNHKGAKKSYLVRRQDALNFRRNHVYASDLSKVLNVSQIKVNAFLAAEGVMPISGPLINSGNILIYRKSSISSATLKSLKKRARLAAQLMPSTDVDSISLSNFKVSVDSLSKETSLSIGALTRLFITSKIVPHIKEKALTFITSQGKKKINGILKNYVSLQQASAILNVPCDTIRNLIVRKQLILLDTTPFHPRANPGLISHKQIEEIRIKLANR